MRISSFLLSVISAGLCCTPIMAQQAQEEERTDIPYEYHAFRDATVTMMFGSRKQVKGNIYLDGSKFYFMQNGKSIEADLSNIHRVAFGDSLYIPVENRMARIVEEDSSKMLVCVRTIDLYEMKGRKDGFGGRDQSGEGLPFAQIDINGNIGLIELDNHEAQAKAKMFPIRREYFFVLNGDVIPAKERPVMSRYTKAERKRLRIMTEDRFWSWKDEESLAKLLHIL